MTSNTDDAMNIPGPYRVDHQGDLAATFEHASPNAADVRARGAADRMWQKVEEELEQIDRAPTDEAADD